MFRRKRADTRVLAVERRYGVDLNARADMRLGTLLRQRGFDSLSQLLRARAGQLSRHASARRVFLSFHREDLRQVTGFRLMLANQGIELSIGRDVNRRRVASEHSAYVKEALRKRIRESEVVLCLIGNRTAWREGVDWELRTARSYGIGIAGARLKGSHGRPPAPLIQADAPIARWDPTEIIAAIEAAAARR